MRRGANGRLHSIQLRLAATAIWLSLSKRGKDIAREYEHMFEITFIYWALHKGEVSLCISNKKIANHVLFALLCSFDIGNWDVFHVIL